MSKALEFALKMVDKVSGPAKGIGGALSGVSSRLDLAGKAMLGASSIGAGIGMRLGGGLVDMAVSGAKFAFSAGKFRDETILALSMVDGTSEAAAKTFDRISKIANITPFGPEQVASAITGLRLAGKTQEVAEGIFGIASDLASMGAGNKSENLGRIISGMSKGMNQGKFSMETLESLSSVGGSGAFLKSFARINNITAQQASKALADGVIDANKGLAAMMDMATGGGTRGVGDATVKMGLGTVDGQLASIKNTMFGIMAMDTKPMVNALAKVNTELSAAAPSLSKVNQAFTNGIYAGFADMMEPTLKTFGLAAQGSGGLADAFRTTGQALGFVASAVTAVILTMATGVGVIAKLIDMAGYALAATFDIAGKILAFDFAGIGEGIADGISHGFDAGFARFKAVSLEKWSDLKSAWKTAWGIQSPSKVTYEMFEYVGQGAISGFEDSVQPLSKSMNGLVAGVTSGVSQGVSGGGGRPIVNNSFHIQSSDPKEAAAEVRRVIESYFLQWSAA